MKASIKCIETPRDKRIICVSDIHGSLDLLKRLLGKVDYTGGDMLVLLGDLYTKGRQGHETLRYIMGLSQCPNVYALRGNCDWLEEYLSDSERRWLEGLPHIIESPYYLFVHGGIAPGPLEGQDAIACMKNDAFMDKGLSFDKYVITGHWPTINYTHDIPCYNPIIDRERRVIAIDGGTVIKRGGQLNAFIIDSGAFSFVSADELPLHTVQKAQAARGGSLNITWNDRFIELAEAGPVFSLYKHLVTGRVISLPNETIWADEKGRLSGSSNGTDYFLPVSAGDVVSVIGTFGDRMLAKKDGTAGWIDL